MRIRRMRFPERITFLADISSEVEEALIPPFVIRSFVENSIKYAINFEQHNICSIRGTVLESHYVGIRNVRQRLRLVFGEKMKLILKLPNKAL